MQLVYRLDTSYMQFYGEQLEKNESVFCNCILKDLETQTLTRTSLPQL
jgi:hypothetical protein